MKKTIRICVNTVCCTIHTQINHISCSPYLVLQYLLYISFSKSDMFSPLSALSEKYASDYQLCSQTAGVLPTTLIVSKHLLRFKNTSKCAWVWSGHVLVCFDMPSRSEQLGSLRICWSMCVTVWAHTAERLQLWFCTPNEHNCISSWQENVTVMITETKSSYYVQKFIYFLSSASV